MDVRKLRGPFLQIHYSFLRLIAAVKDVLEADQAMGLIKELTAAQFGSTYAGQTRKDKRSARSLRRRSNFLIGALMRGFSCEGDSEGLGAGTVAARRSLC